MAGEDLIELKFRLADGTDIGPSKYNPSTTVGSLKEKIIAQWPKGYKDNAPKTINDVKLINAGKILENNKTLAESRLPIGELPGAVITMHVVVRPPFSDKNNGRFPKEEQVLLYHPVTLNAKIDSDSLVGFYISPYVCQMVAQFCFKNSPDFRYSWLQLAAETRTLEVDLCT
ncbi:unnamed protein product [Camellia sinensis]